MIEFFSPEDLSHIAAILAERREAEVAMSKEANEAVEEVREAPTPDMPVYENTTQLSPDTTEEPKPQPPDEDIYSISNFVV